MIFPFMKKLFAPSGKGSITFLAVLLLGSASIRILTSGSEVLAQDGQLPTAPQSSTTADTMTATSNEDAFDAQSITKKPVSASLKNRSEMSLLLKSLTEREAQILSREKKLKLRIQALSIADEEIEKRIQYLKNTEESLRATLSQTDQASEKDLLKLTSVYENMKPKEAAALFEQMEPNFAAGFLARMRPEIAASVMAGLTPQFAYSVSVILAGRNANVPKT